MTVGHARAATVFDWDDTLLPSTWLAAKGYRLDIDYQPVPEIEEQLRKLEAAVIAVLEQAMRYGPVHVVTNAEEGWVELSASKFIPAVVDTLNRVTVISARSTFEAAYPGKPLHWKVCAMERRLQQSFNDPATVKNVLSFGDSHVEREAVKIATVSMQTDPRCAAS